MGWNGLKYYKNSAGGAKIGCSQHRPLEALAKERLSNFSFNGGRDFGGISLCRQVMRQRNPWRSRTSTNKHKWGFGYIHGMMRHQGAGRPWWVNGEKYAHKLTLQQLSLHVVGQMCNDQSEVHGVIHIFWFHAPISPYFCTCC